MYIGPCELQQQCWGGERSRTVQCFQVVYALDRQVAESVGGARCGASEVSCRFKQS